MTYTFIFSSQGAARAARVLLLRRVKVLASSIQEGVHRTFSVANQDPPEQTWGLCFSTQNELSLNQIHQLQIDLRSEEVQWGVAGR